MQGSHDKCICTRLSKKRGNWSVEYLVHFVEPKIQEVLLGHLRGWGQLWNKNASEPVYTFLPALLRSSVPGLAHGCLSQLSVLYSFCQIRDCLQPPAPSSQGQASTPHSYWWSEEWCERAPRATLWVCTAQLDKTVPLREYTTDKARIESKSVCSEGAMALAYSAQHWNSQAGKTKKRWLTTDMPVSLDVEMVGTILYIKFIVLCLISLRLCCMSCLLLLSNIMCDAQFHVSFLLCHCVWIFHQWFECFCKDIFR